MSAEINRDEQWAVDVVRPKSRVGASDYFKERVMRAISEEDARASARRWTWSWPQGWLKLAPAAVIAALLMLLAVPMFHSTSPSAKLFAQSIDAMSRTHSVHIIGRMRTLPGDNFELIGADYDFVPFEIWREYSNPPKWRIEKPGRVVAMDGKAAVLYMSNTNTAVAGSPNAGFVEWMRPLLDPQSILEQELEAVKSNPESKILESNGVKQVSLRRAAGGNYGNDWAKNKSISDSDHTTVYRFDAATKRLEGLHVEIVASGRPVTVLELTAIRYNEPVAQGLFALQLPPDVIWSGDGPTKATVSFNGPKEAVAYFFDTMAREDWDSTLNVYPASRVNPVVQRVYGGMRVVSLGEPFQSGLYRGWFVPYEIRLKDGHIKSHKLAVRNDNPQKRWVVDGGF